MNELSPGIFRSLPAGSGGAGWAGTGIRSEAWARETLECSASRRPPRPATVAVPATTTPVFRKLRRSGPAGGRQRSTQVDEPDGVAGARGPGDDGGRLSGLRSCGPSSPDRAVPVRGLIGSAAGGAARTSSTSATAAAAPPTSDGSTKLAEAVGRDSAAVVPIAVNTARPAIPYQILRMASRPTIAANTASTARMPVTRTSLSFEPKAEIAKFFTGGGVRSIEASPTATTGEPSGATIPAMSWPTPIATAAASSPATSPRAARARSESGVTLIIRRRAPVGLGPGRSHVQAMQELDHAEAGARPKPAAVRQRI